MAKTTITLCNMENDKVRDPQTTTKEDTLCK